MTVRTKFRVEKIELTTSGGMITLYPVDSGSPDNDEFFKYTPRGERLRLAPSIGMCWPNSQLGMSSTSISRGHPDRRLQVPVGGIQCKHYKSTR